MAHSRETEFAPRPTSLARQASINRQIAVQAELERKRREILERHGEDPTKNRQSMTDLEQGSRGTAASVPSPSWTKAFGLGPQASQGRTGTTPLGLGGQAPGATPPMAVRPSTGAGGGVAPKTFLGLGGAPAAPAQPSVGAVRQTPTGQQQLVESSGGNRWVGFTGNPPPTTAGREAAASGRVTQRDAPFSYEGSPDALKIAGTGNKAVTPYGTISSRNPAPGEGQGPLAGNQATGPKHAPLVLADPREQTGAEIAAKPPLYDQPPAPPFNYTPSGVGPSPAMAHNDISAPPKPKIMDPNRPMIDQPDAVPGSIDFSGGAIDAVAGFLKPQPVPQSTLTQTPQQLLDAETKRRGDMAREQRKDGLAAQVATGQLPPPSTIPGNSTYRPTIAPVQPPAPATPFTYGDKALNPLADGSNSATAIPSGMPNDDEEEKKKRRLAGTASDPSAGL